MYIAKVKAKHKEAVLMYGCYVEVVFNFIAKAMHYPNLVPVLDIYPYILFHFKNVFLLLVYRNISKRSYQCIASK